MNDSLTKVLRKHKEVSKGSLVSTDNKENRIQKNELRKELMQISKKRDFSGVRKIHSLRHTFASHLVMKGVDLPAVKNFMGHSEIETPMIYSHLANENIDKAVKKLKFLPPLLKIALMIGLWLSLFFGPLAPHLANKSPEQLPQMAKNDIIRERIKSFADGKTIDEYKLIRQTWKEAFGLDVWYPYFAAKELEDKVKKKLGVKIYIFKGEPQIENNMVSYKFKTTF